MKPRPHTIDPLMLLGVLAASLLPTPLLAQDARGGQDEQVPDLTTEIITDPSVVDEWVRQLDADDWLMRDMATLELGELDPGVSLETLEGYLRHQDLSPEQRARLHLACLRRYAMRPKGALGVSFGTVRAGAIEIEPIPIDPRFPATTMLMPGDQIAMVGDRVMDDTLSLRIEILSRDPGQILPLTIIRENKVMRLDVPLGTYGNLTGAVRMDADLLVGALRRRWERLGIVTEPAGSIGEGITTADWQAAAFPSTSTPEPRKPELAAPRGFVRGPGIPVHPDGLAWDRTMINVWSDPETLRESVEQRAGRLAVERVTPMLALSRLIQQEREEILAALEQMQGEEGEALRARLKILDERLETVTELLRPQEPPSP